MINFRRVQLKLLLKSDILPLIAHLSGGKWPRLYPCIQCYLVMDGKIRKYMNNAKL